MDILLLDPAGPQPRQQRVAEAGSASRRFDAQLRESRPRVESDDLETYRPGEPDAADVRERGEDLAPGRDSGADARDDGPAPGPQPRRDGHAGDVVADKPGDQPQPRLTLGGVDTVARAGGVDTAVLADVIRLAVAPQANSGGTAAATEHGATIGDSLTRRAPAAARSPRGGVLPLHIGAMPQDPEPATHRVVQDRHPLVRLAPIPMPPVVRPQGALGTQAALAAQNMVAGATETLSKEQSAVPDNAAATRAQATATKSAVATKSAAAKLSVAATQTGRAAGAAPNSLAPFKLPSVSIAASAEFPGNVSAGPLGPLGFAAPSFGLSAPLTASYAAATARPEAGLPFAAEQVAVQIHKAANAGQDRINIRLYPADLGRVEVRLEWADDGALRAVISAERSDTLDLLQRDSRALDRALQDAGLKTDSDSLSFDLRSHAERRDTAAEAGGDVLEQSDPEHYDDETTAADVDAPHKAHDGVLDISV